MNLVVFCYILGFNSNILLWGRVKSVTPRNAHDRKLIYIEDDDAADNDRDSFGTMQARNLPRAAICLGPPI